jgi:uncharacterized protein
MRQHLTILSMTLVASVAPLYAQTTSGASSARPEIVTSGVGTVTLKPDGATVVLGVVTRAATAAQVGADNARQMQSLLATLRRMRVADSSIVTSGFVVYSERDPSRGNVIPAAHVARNQVRVRVTDVNGVGTIVDSALANGATEVGSLTFTSSRQQAARQEAIALAVAAARTDAVTAVGASGGSAPTLVELSFLPDQALAFASQAAAVAEVPSQYSRLLPRDVVVTVSVRARYSFRPY